MVVTGIYYALALVAAGGLVGFLASWPWSIPFYILAAFCLYFFRDPEREIPGGPVSPADGKVVAVVPEGNTNRISIFLNIFDVHVNRAPVGGDIVEIRYQPGKFMVASREEASTQNEMNTLTVLDGSSTVVCKQIAGLIARRIVCYKHPGEKVKTGERIGLIKFGSRCDVHFGPEWEIAVRAGERVSAGSSILARRRSAS
jgi:phosphatidylserine decarboxylase